MDKRTRRRMEDAAGRPEANNLPSWADATRRVPELHHDDHLGEIPEYPKNITVMSYHELGGLFSHYNAHLGYINQKCAEATFEHRRAKAHYKTVRSKKLFVTTGPFKAKVFAAVNKDKEIIELQKDLLEKEAVLSAYTMLMWTLKGNMDAIKFEVERRRDRLQAGKYDD